MPSCRTSKQPIDYLVDMMYRGIGEHYAKSTPYGGDTLFSLAQTILEQLLTAKNTNPERLSESEMILAKRICHCVKCQGFWVRMKGKLPERCPKCHSREWDRPFLTALVNADKGTPGPHLASTRKDEGGRPL